MSEPREIAKIVLLGASGTIGTAVAREFAAEGYAVTCPVRRHCPELSTDVTQRIWDPEDPASLAAILSDQGPGAALISCLASRTGTPEEAWRIDHVATANAFRQAHAAGFAQGILLSAICVQEAELPFQQAKLAAEDALMQSGLDWAIIRPTAFFKSLSGQVERVRAGKPFLVFGDGRQTACKPISDGDLARYVRLCLEDPQMHGRILPVGGPGAALTPTDQVALLSDLLGRPVPVRRIPLSVLTAVTGTLSALARLFPALRPKADMGQIARFYATRSMLVQDPVNKGYSAEKTPSFGTETLADHYQSILKGNKTINLGSHTVFDRKPRRKRTPL
ncbi:NAD(P)H-binding protein [Palleronia caenipelagi]|uniref:Divinyl chlorophyllide a 8-vinyl-reductase, chloroplastic n=1 Tax=Palleronia caenipelagi TaxID=2489174 RepID=A0A547Q053_9RHOB|nr:NAD(P)H-binding protein [Palleronia caenipelagi]TRD19781.1 NAD-dependent epimerase/dehydratase family protein [Palleronia caenipelagi]